MKQSHLILTMGMIAWFSAASPQLTSVDETSNMITQTILYEPSQNESALGETTLSEATQPEADKLETYKQEAVQREEALQLMEERRLDSRRSALQFLPFEPESRR